LKFKNFFEGSICWNVTENGKRAGIAYYFGIKLIFLFYFHFFEKVVHPVREPNEV